MSNGVRIAPSILGADTFVAGNAIFTSRDPAREVSELRRRCLVTV